MLMLLALAGCGAKQVDYDATCTISISCATILDNMDACDPDKREQVPGGRRHSGPGGGGLPDRGKRL